VPSCKHDGTTFNPLYRYKGLKVVQDGTSYSLSATMHSITERQTDDSMMPIANHTDPLKRCMCAYVCCQAIVINVLTFTDVLWCWCVDRMRKVKPMMMMMR